MRDFWDWVLDTWDGLLLNQTFRAILIVLLVIAAALLIGVMVGRMDMSAKPPQ
jgi:hypothetical protein